MSGTPAQKIKPGVMPTPHSLPDAPLWRRLAAMVYDGFLLMGIWFVYGYVVVLFEATILQMDIEHAPTGGGNPFVFAGLLLLLTGFFCLFWLKNGQTLGMQAWRLQIEPAIAGQPLTLHQCLIRLAAACLSLVCAGLGYGWCLLPGHRTWHDRLSGTRITVHPKRS